MIGTNVPYWILCLNGYKYIHLLSDTTDECLIDVNMKAYMITRGAVTAPTPNTATMFLLELPLVVSALSGDTKEAVAAVCSPGWLSFGVFSEDGCGTSSSPPFSVSK